MTLFIEGKAYDTVNTFTQPICNYCKYYNQDGTCQAFPERIPDEILEGKNNHSRPLPEQQNTIIFVDIRENP